MKIKMKITGKLFISFATSSLAHPLSQEILNLSKNISYLLWLILFICFSVYFIGSEIGFWKDLVFEN